MRPGRALSLASLAALGLAAWAYLGWMTVPMRGAEAMAGMAMPGPGPAALAAMWAVMMVAMMAPAVAPSYSLYTGLDRGSGAAAPLHAGAYLAGYLGTWALFGIAAAAAQQALSAAGLMSADMALLNPAPAGALLIAAGAYQWSPLKARCVARCRSPLGFLLSEWRDGTRGALILGWRYGLACVGCCWLLMGLLFVVGAMNLGAALALSAYILLERLLPLGRRLDRALGVALIAWGAWLVAAAARA